MIHICFSVSKSKSATTSEASEGLSVFLVQAFFVQAFLLMLRVCLQAPLQAPLPDDLESLHYVAGRLLVACMSAESSRSRERLASIVC